MAGCSVGEALAEGRRTLTGHSDSAALDTQVLLAEVTGAPREHLLAHPDEPLAYDQQAMFFASLARLAAGEPLPYVLGWWEFYGRRFRVSADVLIPRPETELLVEEAVQALEASPAGTRLVELGTGSGCVAVTLALALPGRRLLATDTSPAALNVARSNAARYQVMGRIDFVRLDLAAGLRLGDSLVVANLPYVATASAAGLPHEPRLALEAGEDGLRLFRRLIGQFGRRRPERTTVLLEIGDSQAGPVRALAQAGCDPARVWLVQDLTGCDRVLGMEF